MVRKKTRHEVEVQLDYLGFDLPDVWVVGYGLDYAEQYRTLPYIGIVEPNKARNEERRSPSGERSGDGTMS